MTSVKPTRQCTHCHHQDQMAHEWKSSPNNPLITILVSIWGDALLDIKIKFPLICFKIQITSTTTSFSWFKDWVQYSDISKLDLGWCIHYLAAIKSKKWMWRARHWHHGTVRSAWLKDKFPDVLSSSFREFLQGSCQNLVESCCVLYKYESSHGSVKGTWCFAKPNLSLVYSHSKYIKAGS